MAYEEILSFWFEEATPQQWWGKDEQFDELIKHRFGDIHQQATKCELFGWRSEPLGRLAEIIVLDQFSRNIYRDEVLAFAADSLALGLAQEGVRLKVDEHLSVSQRTFFYMPYMHSESKMIQQQSVALFRNNGVENNIDFAIQHKKIIDRFGRYPHRNSILGRPSTVEEIEFLTQPGSSF